MGLWRRAAAPLRDNPATAPLGVPFGGEKRMRTDRLNGLANASQAVGTGTVLLLAAAQFAAFVDRAAPAVVVAPMKAAFGLTDGQIGAMQGPAFALTYAVAMLAAGHWVRRIEPFRLMSLCVAIWTLGGVGFALAPDFPSMMGARMVLGVGQAAFAPAALIVLGSAAVGMGRARAVSLFTTGSAIGRSGGLFLGGAVLVAVAGQTVMGLAPWRAASLALVLPNLALIVGLLVLSGRRGPWVPPSSSGLHDALGWMMGEGRRVTGLFIAGAGCVLSVQSAGAWLPSIVHRQFGLSVPDAALLVGGIVLLAAPAGHLSAGWFLGRPGAQRIGPAGLLITGLILSAVAAAGLLLASSLIAATLAIGLLVGGSGLAAAVALIALQPMMPDRLRGGVNAVYLAGVSVVGVGLGPWITGALSDRHAASAQGLTLALVEVVVAVALVIVPVALWSGRNWAGSIAD